jgi:hypothetical protein
MALLFQSNPDQWNLREHFIPGNSVSWKVTRYSHLMKPGVLVLLWVARGKQPEQVRGLFGWGITTQNVEKNMLGKLHINLKYIERWVNPEDEKNNIENKTHQAPIPASEVLNLKTWEEHLLSLFPTGTNFLVTPAQLSELEEKVIRKKIPDSQFKQAVYKEISGKVLNADSFTPKSLVAVD